MPNPKLETYKSKKTGTVYDYTDANAQSAITGMKDGTNIDSFGDVETALGNKADASSVTAIEGKIPSSASSSNKLATASDVASRVDWSSYAKTGASNFNSYPYDLYDRTNPFTQATMTITFKDKGVVNINGTANTNGDLDIHRRVPNNDDSDLYLPIGKYRFYCDVTSNYSIASTYNGSFKKYAEVINGNGFDFEITADTQSDYKKADGSVLVAIYIGYTNGQVFDNADLHPMILVQDDKDNSWRPWSMTNGELTELVEGIIDAATNAADFAAFKTAIGSL